MPWEQTYRQETIEEFAARQGCAYIGLPRRSTFDPYEFLLENGATSDGENHQEPPEDPIELLHAKRRYVVAKLEDLERNHKQFMTYVQNQSRFHAMGAGPSVTEDEVSSLEELTAEIVELQNRIADIDSELTKPTEADLRAQEYDRQEQARQDALQARIRDCRL